MVWPFFLATVVALDVLQAVPQSPREQSLETSGLHRRRFCLLLFRAHSIRFGASNLRELLRSLKPRLRAELHKCRLEGLAALLQPAMGELSIPTASVDKPGRT